MWHTRIQNPDKNPVGRGTWGCETSVWNTCENDYSYFTVLPINRLISIETIWNLEGMFILGCSNSRKKKESQFSFFASITPKNSLKLLLIDQIRVKYGIKSVKMTTSLRYLTSTLCYNHTLVKPTDRHRVLEDNKQEITCKMTIYWCLTIL